MKQNKQKEPMKENTKDDSSDIKKVKQQQSEAKAGSSTSGKAKSKESEEAHSFPLCTFAADNV